MQNDQRNLLTNLRVLKLSDMPLATWANGRGITQELAASDSGKDWTWRVSVAQMSTEQTFSVQPGVTRMLALASGSWMELIFNNDHRVCVNSRTVTHVNGGLAMRGVTTPNASVSILSLMVRGIDGQMCRVGAEPLPAVPNCMRGLYTSRPATLLVGNGQSIEVGPHTLILEDEPFHEYPWQLASPHESRAWWLRIAPALPDGI